MKKGLIYCLLFLCITFANSQDYQLGKVTVEDLKQTQHTIEKDAPAAKLFTISKVYISFSQNKGFELITEVETKIKIYTNEGLKYANFSVPVYTSNADRETVNFTDAYTYNLDEKGKVDKTKLRSDGEFEEKLNKFVTLKKITMPNVKVGSVIEFKYTVKSPFLSKIDEWAFQSDIPVNYSEYTFRYPEYFQYTPFVKGTVNLNPKNTVEAKRIKITTKDRYTDGRALSTEFSESEINYNEIINNFSTHNVPSLKEEKFVKNINNFKSSITFELASVKYPNEPFKLLSTTWTEVANSINLSEDFGGQLTKNGFYESEINDIIKGLKTNEEKIVAILQFTKSKVKWNGIYGIYTDEGLRSAYKNGVGNVADINLLLTTFLRHAGLNANPVISSSVSNGIPLFPSRTAFNYVLAGVDINNNTYLLDATDTFSFVDILPFRAINWRGLMIYPTSKTKEIALDPQNSSIDNIMMNYEILNTGEIKGSVKRQLSNYNAFNYRNKYGLLDKESLINTLQNKFNNIKIDEIFNENISQLHLPVNENYSFTDTKSVEIIGDKIYFSPLLFLAMENNPLKSESRDFPIEFPYPNVDKYMVKVKIPEGYTVESLPNSENLVFDDKNMFQKYMINFDETTNTLNLLVQELNQLLILSGDNYNAVKDYFNKKYIKQNDKVVLKRK